MKGDAKDVKPIRDTDEGSCGPVYYLCAHHRQKLIDFNSRDYDPHYYGYDD